MLIAHEMIARQYVAQRVAPADIAAKQMVRNPLLEFQCD